MKQKYDQRSDKVKSEKFRLLPSEEEGRSTRASVWDVAAKDWPGDFFFLRVVTLV